jgi:tripartite-type tricarboxylate transporter receptor subunit TctC
VKPIRVIDANPPGGTTDWLARMIAPRFAESTGHQWIVDNRPGAQGIIGMQLASKTPADGYTLLMFTGSQAVHPSFYRNLPHDLLRDFAPVTQTTRTVNVLLVHPSVPANTVKELIALAKSRPGELNYASAGLGSQNHMAMELFNSMTSTNMAHIPYKATQSAVTDMLGGRVDLMIGAISIFLPHIKAGKIRALAVSAEKRSIALPNVPTVSEAGVPRFYTSNSTGVLAPAGTPRQIITKLNGEILRILSQPDVRDVLATSGHEIVGSTPEQFGEYLRTEVAQWANLIKQIGLTPQQW